VQDGDALRRISSDHSLVEQLILGGMISPEERYTHPHRNRIYRSLGGEEKVELDIFTQRLRPGMRLLLCSDGLWEMTHDPEIEQILRQTESPYAACAALIASANEHGGEDNITAVIAQVDA
jgi:protein phosphatase